MRRILIVLAITLFTGHAEAATTIRLPAWLCAPATSDTIFPAGFEADETRPYVPSHGAGGSVGDETRVIESPTGPHLVYVHAPPGYTSSRAWPLMIALHGTAGSGAAPAAARQVRADWTSIADAHGFVVIAPVASGGDGSWSPPVDIPAIAAAINDALTRYDIDEARVDLWGFSAGAHLAHAIALGNTGFFAAYGVSAGSLTQYACTDSGSPPPACADLLGDAQPKIPVDIHLGSQDPLYLSFGAGGDPVRFEHAGWVLGEDLFYTLFPGGHEYTVAQLGEIYGNICPFALGP
jgi:poly(3-hydroxybutyrate) depolymerase